MPGAERSGTPDYDAGEFPAGSYFHPIATLANSVTVVGDQRPHRMNDIRVAIVEDKAETRKDLARLLAKSSGFTCVAACETGEEALRRIPGESPDIILMDIELPGLSGIDCVPRLRAVLPKTQIMMLTVFEDHESIFNALASGATGYLLKSRSDVELLEAIRELHGGGAPMSGQIARLVVSSFQKPPRAANALLTLTEQKVLTLLARGLLYKEVAQEMGLGMGTIRAHVCHIYGKLHVTNRTQAVLKALG